MEQIIYLLPILAFIALAAGVVVVFRGTGQIAARAREMQRFRGAVKDLAARTDEVLGAAAGEVDAVRHQQVEAESISLSVAEAAEALEGFGEEARGWSPPRRAGTVRDDIVAELERAVRALGMVRHGTEILAAPRHGGPDLEAQMTIKRGYLNLVHAREAIARHALRAQGLIVDETRGGRLGPDA
jgi:hypothetical protein